MPESSFTIDKIMHLRINFHKLDLTRGRSRNCQNGKQRKGSDKPKKLR